MAIDYQQILMDMNRPSRRQGSGLKKMFFALMVLAVLGGGGYAVWHFGVIGTVWGKATQIVGGLLGKSETEGAAGGGVALDVQVANQVVPQDSSLRPPANAVAAPVPSPNGPISVAANSNAAPASAAPAVPVNTAPVQAPSQAVTTVRPSAPGPNMAPAPVLSGAKAQIKVIDQLLASNPAEAMRRSEELVKTPLAPEDAAEAGYRVGYAARMLRDEAKAEVSWKGTADKWPTLLGGKYAALALADTWYRRYAGEQAQTSYWDDIQLMYSRVLGDDDAPFLPDAVRAGVKANLKRINDSLFFGAVPTKLARYHKVESGELLSSIAGQYRVDYESIARINGIDPNRVRAGIDLKLIVGEVSIVVRKNSKDPNKTPTVTWYLDGRWVREYPACVGDGNKTPAGTYSLVSKERDPSWTNPANGQLLSNDHPENILGSRWMAMKGMNTQGLGIHGTTVNDSIPGYTSAGCVRLLNKDVEELFSFARIGNKVTVLE